MRRTIGAQRETIGVQPAPWQAKWEWCMRLYVMLFSAFHIFLTIFRYYDSIDTTGLRTADYILGGILVLQAAAYWFLVKRRNPGTLPRAKAYVRGLVNRESLLLFGMLVWFGISCLAVSADQNGNWFQYNLWPMFDFAISALLFFPMARLLRDDDRRTLHILFDFLIVILGACMIYVLYVLATTQYAETKISALYIANSRLSAFSNPNTTGTYAALMVMISVYMCAVRSKFWKPLYILSALIQFSIVALSNSLASLLSLMFGIGFAGMILAWRFLKGKGKWLRYSVGALVCLAAMLLVYWAKGLVFAALANWFGLDMTARTADTVEFTLSGRLLIWITAIKAMFSSFERFLFGVTPASVSALLNAISDGATANMYTHNELLEVGVALGVPGLAAFLWWLILIAKRSLRIGLDEENGLPLAEKLLPVILLTQIVNNMAEAILLFYHFMNGAVFFIVAGYVAVRGKQIEPELPKAAANRGKKPKRK